MTVAGARENLTYEAFGVAACDGVENEQALARSACLGLGVLHEHLRDPTVARSATHEQLRDLASVRLVRWQREDDLDGTDWPKDRWRSRIFRKWFDDHIS